MGCTQKSQVKYQANLGSGPPYVYGGSLNQDQVADFEQNFIWFYKTGGINSTIATPNLMFDVDNDFLANIDTSNWSEPSDTGIVLYYSIVDISGSKYLSYLFSNACFDEENDSIILLGLYDNANHTYIANKFLRLNENQSPATTEIDGRQNYVTNYVSTMELNQITDTIIKIDTMPNHPHVCFFNKVTLYNFYNDNRVALNGGTEKKIVFKHGAIDKGLLLNSEGISKCKVQTPILIFKVDGSLLLSNEANLNNPFMNHAMDVGQLCPPGDCSCN